MLLSGVEVEVENINILGAFGLLRGGLWLFLDSPQGKWDFPHYGLPAGLLVELDIRRVGTRVE